MNDPRDYASELEDGDFERDLEDNFLEDWDDSLLEPRWSARFKRVDSDELFDDYEADLGDILDRYEL